MQVEDNRSTTLKQKGSAFFNKLKGVKNLRIIAVIFIIAIALIIYSSVMTKRDDSDQVATSAMTSDEARLSAILSNIEGAGIVDVMITSSDGKIKGVLVIADGGKDILVRLRLIDAAATALGVGKDIINVYARQK